MVDHMLDLHNVITGIDGLHLFVSWFVTGLSVEAELDVHLFNNKKGVIVTGLVLSANNESYMINR